MLLKKTVEGRHEHRMGGIRRKDRKQEIHHTGREQARGIRDALLKGVQPGDSPARRGRAGKAEELATPGHRGAAAFGRPESEPACKTTRDGDAAETPAVVGGCWGGVLGVGPGAAAKKAAPDDFVVGGAVAAKARKPLCPFMPSCGLLQVDLAVPSVAAFCARAVSILSLCASDAMSRGLHPLRQLARLTGAAGPSDQTSSGPGSAAGGPPAPAASASIPVAGGAVAAPAAVPVAIGGDGSAGPAASAPGPAHDGSGGDGATTGGWLSGSGLGRSKERPETQQSSPRRGPTLMSWQV